MATTGTTSRPTRFVSAIPMISASSLTDRFFHLHLKDHEGVEYLMLANHMLSTLFPFVTTIAEDFAGFPTLALPTHLGGVGFNYRLGLGNPDFCESPFHPWASTFDSRVPLFGIVRQGFIF